MEQILQALLDRLADIGERHAEIFDSEVRERMSDTILSRFVRQEREHPLPHDFGMYSDDANEAVRRVLSEYIEAANDAAVDLGITGFRARLEALQDTRVRTKRTYDYEDFFGHIDPELFDDNGRLISSF